MGLLTFPASLWAAFCSGNITAAYLVMLWATSPWIVVLALGVSGLLLWLMGFMQRSASVTL